MRIALTDSIIAAVANNDRFKLQHATSTGGAWTDVSAAGSSASAWQYYNNAGAADKATISSTLITGSTVVQSYTESNPTEYNPNAIPLNGIAEWDFALDASAASSETTYYFRMVAADGTTLSAYPAYPQLTTAASSLSQASYRLFDNLDAPGVGGANMTGPTNFATGSGPGAVANPDLNSDGKDDLVVANYNGGFIAGSISVRLNTTAANATTPTFSASTDFATNNGPNFITALDVNADGKQDLAVSNTGNGTLSIFLNTTATNASTPSFSAKTDLSTGTSPTSVAAGDINRDGKPDLAATNYGSNNFSVFLNTTAANASTASFSTKTDVTTGTSPTGVLIVDIDRDGLVDVVTANFTSNNFTVIPNTTAINATTPTFNTVRNFATGTSPYYIAAGDLNGDNIVDIATANNGTTTASVFLNTTLVAGTPSFTAKVDVTAGSAPKGVAIDDMDGDGKSDLIVSNTGSTSISVLLNTTETSSLTATYAAKEDFTVGGSPSPLSAADINNDGQPDISVTNSTSDTVSVLLNNYNTVPRIDVGTQLAAQNTAGTVPVDGQPFRMRLNVGVSVASLGTGTKLFKLQFAPRTTACDTSFTNTTSASYADVTTTSTVRYYNNTNATNAMALETNANDPTDGSNTLVRQTYQESGTTTFTSTSAVPAGQDGMWDFALTTASTSAGQRYCLRVVASSGTVLNSYAAIPEIVIPGASALAPNTPSTLAQAKADTTPITGGNWSNNTGIMFTAVATDGNTSDMLQICVEKDLIGTPFSNVEDTCGTAVSYTGTQISPSLIISGIAESATKYHWQARIKDAGGLYSSWVNYNTGLDATGHFGIDATAPTGGTVYDGSTTNTDAAFNNGSLSALSANWSGITDSFSGISKYEYSIGVAPGGVTTKGYTDNALTTSINATPLSLQTSNKYYFNVRTTDNAGNTSIISSDGQLVAPTVSFAVAPASITFNNLNGGNAYTDSTKTTSLTTSTNAYGGYIVRSFMSDLLRSSAGNKTINNFTGGSYASPDSWQTGDTGFGYTSSDALIQNVNKYQSATCPGGSVLASPGCYAPFSLTGPGDIVADHTSNVTGTPLSNQAFTINYRVGATSTTAATKYNSNIIYTITPVY